MMQEQRFQDKNDAIEVEDELNAINSKTKDIMELTESLASLIETQSEPMNNINESTQVSSDQILQGVKLLARVRSKQAYKHKRRGGISLAIVGAVTGVSTLGPIGLLIGAVTGAVLGRMAGNTLTQVSKNIISNEILQLEQLTNLKILGDKRVSTKIEIYELERRFFGFKSNWIPFKIKDKKAKIQKYWTTLTLKELSYTHPVPERHINFFSKAPVSNFLSFALGNNLLKACEKELESFDWEWDKRGWICSNNWEYAFSKDSDWFNEYFTTAFVRRRKWVITIFGQVHGDESQLQSKIPLKTKNKIVNAQQKEEVFIDSGLKENHELKETLSSFDTIRKINVRNSEIVGEQDEIILETLTKAKLVEDSTIYASRIDRAADFTGIIQNLWKSTTVSNSIFSELTSSSINKDKLKSSKTKLDPESRNLKKEEDLDQLKNEVNNNLSVMKTMNERIINHNEQLNKIGSSLEKASENLKKINE